MSGECSRYIGSRGDVRR